MNGMVVECPGFITIGPGRQVIARAVVVEFFPDSALCIAVDDCTSTNVGGKWLTGEFARLDYAHIRSIPTPTAQPADGSHTCVRGHGGKCQICGNRMVLH